MGRSSRSITGIEPGHGEIKLRLWQKVIRSLFTFLTGRTNVPR
jgi:hypothetical protein